MAAAVRPAGPASTEISPTATTAAPPTASSRSGVTRIPDSTSTSQITGGVSAITPPKSLPIDGQPSQITTPKPMIATTATAAPR